jgi:hypothetical protein
VSGNGVATTTSNSSISPDDSLGASQLVDLMNTFNWFLVGLALSLTKQDADALVALPAASIAWAGHGLRSVSQQQIPVVYGTIRIDIGYRADLLCSS